MNRGFGFVLSVPIVFICLFVLLQVGQVRREAEALEEYILSFAIDYSTDAAVEEMLNMSDLGQDYLDINKMNTDPEAALETFTTMMCMNYDLPLTEKAKSQVRDLYIPVFCVAAYDGYYLYTQRSAPDGDYYLQGGYKVPYTYTKEDTPSKYYALNLGGENALLLTDGSLTKVTLESEGIAAEENYRHINSVLSEAISFAFQERTGRGDRIIYLPSDLTAITRVNSVRGPTVFAFIDGWDMKTAHALSAFSIGGAKVENARMVAGYVRINPDGSTTNLYSYADALPESANIPIADLFTSVEEAAQAGYYYDSTYMG